MLSLIIDVYSLLVLVAVVLSWVNTTLENPIRKVTDVAVEPVLLRIRQVMPDMGPLDLSPMVLLIGLRVLRHFLSSLGL